jgi:hypothetical protein
MKPGLTFPPGAHKKALRYMKNWFCQIDMVAEVVGVETKQIQQMIDAKCIPGAVYGFSRHTGWWSALGAFVGNLPAQPPPEAQVWLSPAIVWWARRTVVLGRSGHNLAQIASMYQQGFVDEFAQALQQIEGAEFAKPDCFSRDGTLHVKNAREEAAQEWNGWTSGAYAVCLRNFTAQTCLRKEVLGAMIKRHFEQEGAGLYTEEELICMAQELEALITPFAPWERLTGTPGKTIDLNLQKFGLGVAFPYPGRSKVDIFPQNPIAKIL